MSPSASAYLSKIGQRPSKWRGIALTNLAATLSKEEVDLLLPAVRLSLITAREARIQRLRELGAPTVIMDNEHKMLLAVQEDRDEAIRILLRRRKVFA